MFVFCFGFRACPQWQKKSLKESLQAKFLKIAIVWPYPKILFFTEIQFFRVCLISEMIFQMLIQALNLAITPLIKHTFEKQTLATKQIKMAAIFKDGRHKKSMFFITLEPQVGF